MEQAATLLSTMQCTRVFWCSTLEVSAWSPSVRARSELPVETLHFSQLSHVLCVRSGVTPTGRRSTSVETNRKNKRKDRLIYLLKTQLTQTNSAWLRVDFAHSKDYCKQHFPQLGNAILWNVLDFLKHLFRDAWHKTVVDLFPDPVPALMKVIPTLCLHTLTRALFARSAPGSDYDL